MLSCIEHGTWKIAPLKIAPYTTPSPNPNRNLGGFAGGNLPLGNFTKGEGAIFQSWCEFYRGEFSGHDLNSPFQTKINAASSVEWNK